MLNIWRANCNVCCFPEHDLSQIISVVSIRVKVDHLKVDWNTGDAKHLLHVIHHLRADAVTGNHRHCMTTAIPKSMLTLAQFPKDYQSI